MTERFNMAESFLKRLQTNLFMNIDKKHKKDMTCNTLFLKVKTGDINTYAVKEFNDITKDSVIRIPSHDETKFFENVVKLDGNSVCKYDVSHETLNNLINYFVSRLIAFSLLLRSVAFS